MQRFYVTTRAVWQGSHMIAGRLQPRYNLFHKGTGSAWTDLGSGYILVCTDFDSEWAENEWHGHSDVAHLPHPTLEGAVPLAHLHTKPEYAHKKFKASHFAALTGKFPLAAADTVWDLNTKLKKAGWPRLQLSNVY